MSNLEGEVKKWLIEEYGLNAEDALTAGDVEELAVMIVEWFVPVKLAKQRTQLLKEVREKVELARKDTEKEHGSPSVYFDMMAETLYEELKELEEEK